MAMMSVAQSLVWRKDSCFLSLEAPIARVCGYDVPFPLAFERLYVPDVLKVYDAIKQSVNF